MEQQQAVASKIQNTLIRETLASVLRMIRTADVTDFTSVALYEKEPCPVPNISDSVHGATNDP